MIRLMTFVLVCATLALLQGCKSANRSDEKSVTYDFDRNTVGSQATGWLATETNGQGTPAIWRIIQDSHAPSPPHVVSVIQTRNGGQTYNLMIAQGGEFKDLKLSTYLKASTGQEDQGGGLIWRAQDKNNYYAARWNPLENNFRVYLIKNGRRHQLGSMDVKLNPRQWHQIQICQVGYKITATIDDEEPLEVINRSITKPGKVGLWTKADAATCFDAVSIYSLD